MSVYKKLAEARAKLHQTEIKKSGHNKYAGYTYFELSDFLPEINKIFYEVGLCDVISFTTETATITINDVDDLSSIDFTLPVAEAPLKGALPIQALGAQQTYMRRYLYLLALNITESDAIDSAEPVKPEAVKQVDLTDFESALDSSTDLKNLMEIWNTIPKEHHKSLKSKAAEVKAKLEAQQ